MIGNRKCDMVVFVLKVFQLLELFLDQQLQGANTTGSYILVQGRLNTSPTNHPCCQHTDKTDTELASGVFLTVN